MIGGHGLLKGFELRAQAQSVGAQHASHGIDLRVRNVGCGKRDANRHSISASTGIGAGCLISRPSSWTVARTWAIVAAALPSPYGFTIPRSPARNAGSSA